MIQPAKILVPVDLSERCLSAARYAASLCDNLGSELVFVHALQNGWPLERSLKDVREQIENLRDGSTFLVREGAPAPVIVETAKSESAGLILMPTRGASGIARITGRSITARVLRDAPCPVWAGMEELTPLSERPIRTILCGLSMGPRAGAILRWAASLAERLGAALSVVHAGRGMESTPGYPSDHEWTFWLKKLVRDDIRVLQADAGTNAEVLVEPGKPLAAIPTIAAQLRADLLVIGKSPDRRFLGNFRTMSYDMVCRAPCPVASV
jgi:nucleotide-binding universal stress UspA family protein